MKTDKHFSSLYEMLETFLLSLSETWIWRAFPETKTSYLGVEFYFQFSQRIMPVWNCTSTQILRMIPQLNLLCRLPSPRAMYTVHSTAYLQASRLPCAATLLDVIRFLKVYTLRLIRVLIWLTAGCGHYVSPFLTEIFYPPNELLGGSKWSVFHPI